MGACTFFKDPEANFLLQSKLKSHGNNEIIRSFSAFFAVICDEKETSTFEGLKDSHLFLNSGTFTTISADAAVFIKDFNFFCSLITQNNLPLCVCCFKETDASNQLFTRTLHIPFRKTKFPSECRETESVAGGQKKRSRSRFEVLAEKNLGADFTRFFLPLPIVTEFEGCNIQSTEFQACQKCVDASKPQELDDNDDEVTASDCFNRQVQTDAPAIALASKCVAAFQKSAFGLALSDAQVCALLAIYFCTCMQIYIYIYIYIHLYIMKNNRLSVYLYTYLCDNYFIFIPHACIT